MLRMVAASLLLLFAGSVAAEHISLDKLSEKAQTMAASQPSQSNPYWLFLNRSLRLDTPLNLTDRAKRRRARVDPAGLLIDSLDYGPSFAVIDLIDASGVHIRHVSRWLHAVSVDANLNQLQSVARLPDVVRIDRVHVFTGTPIIEERALDKGSSRSTALAFDYGQSLFQAQFVKAVKLHDAGLTGKGVMLAFFDTGFRITHKAFDSTSFIAMYDFINGDSTVDEFGCIDQVSGLHQNNHGTSTLAVAAANLPGQMIGLAPGADYILAKTEITCNSTEIKREEDNWIAAAEWADSIGADIISSSVGYTVFTDGGSYTFADLDGNTALITIAADIAASKNILVINSAGNERLTSWGKINAPSDGDSVLAVGAVRSDSTLAPFSSPGPTADGRIKPDISTLGVNVITVSHFGGLKIASGTSFAAPLVAGGAALALEHDMTLTAENLRQLIRNSGSQAQSPDNDFGYGLFDATRTADILRIEQSGVISIRNGEQKQVDITTTGRAGSVPQFLAINLPAEIIFTDFGDGSGRLDVTGMPTNQFKKSFAVVADLGYFADTAFFELQTIFSSRAAPNPFTDKISISVPTELGTLRSITVFTAAGEEVWETVNNSTQSADVVYVWDGRNTAGNAVASGVYLIYVETDRSFCRIQVLKIN